MAGLSLTKGDCLSIAGRKYTCSGKGPGGRYALVPHKGRAQKYLFAEELLDLSEQGKIQLHDESDYYGEMPNYQINLSAVSDEQQFEVMKRHFYMVEMDDYRSKGGKLSEKAVASFVLEIHSKYLKHCKERDLPPPDKHMSEAAVRRWYRSWTKSGRHVLSLVRTPSGNRHSKLSWQQVNWLDEIIKTVYLNSERRSAKNVHELLAAKIHLENRNLKAKSQETISVPSYNTLCRRIRQLDLYTVLSKRFNHEYAYKITRHQRKTPVINKHLEIVQADNTQVDIHVDLGIGVLVRPWLTMIIDKYSMSILGFWLAPYSASADTVMNALRQSVMPKKIIELGGEPEWQWPMFGLPEELILDNGADFRGFDLEKAAMDLGINLNFSPPRQAHYKSEVERFFGKINKRLLSKLPGQVYKYEPEKHGLDYPHLTFDEFSKLFIQWAITIAHKTPTENDGYTPDQLWENSIQKNGFAGSGLDQEYVKLCLSKSSRTRYSIQPDGIHFNSLIFNNEWLSRYRNSIASNYPNNKPTAEFKWSESNVGVIWVFDELNHSFFPVEAKEQLAVGRSFFNHSVVLREKRHRKKANLGDSSYQDSILALDNQIIEFGKKKKSKKLPSGASRYVFGSPSNFRENDSASQPSAYPNSVFNDTHTEASSQENAQFDDDLDDDIDDIPDEIEF